MATWLRLASLYNATWGLVMIVSPAVLLTPLLGQAPSDVLGWRVVGMVVLTYAPAYWWAANNLSHARPVVAVGLLGKALGVIGFITLAAAGEMPWRFGVTIVTNDVIWLPAFLSFVVTIAAPVLSRRSRRAVRAGGLSSPLTSPYSALLSHHLDSLPDVYAMQFLAEPVDGVVSIARGRLDRVWCRPRLLRPVFGLTGRLGVLMPRSGQDVPMSLVLRPGVDGFGNPYHVCVRKIDLPGSRFVTRKTFDAELRMLVESMGPRGILQVAWDTQLRFERALVFRQVGFGLRLARRTVWLHPAIWKRACGRARFVQLASSRDPRRVSIRFTLRHPAFGRCFGYEGAFRLESGSDGRHGADEPTASGSQRHRHRTQTLTTRGRIGP